MARVKFTSALQRHVSCAPTNVPGTTVREVLEAVFAGNARARAYVLDDQSALRKHMIVFVNGERVRDRDHLSDRVGEDDEILVMQSLSGG